MRAYRSSALCQSRIAYLINSDKWRAPAVHYSLGFIRSLNKKTWFSTLTQTAPHRSADPSCAAFSVIRKIYPCWQSWNDVTLFIQSKVLTNFFTLNLNWQRRVAAAVGPKGFKVSNNNSNQPDIQSKHWLYGSNPSFGLLLSIWNSKFFKCSVLRKRNCKVFQFSAVFWAKVFHLNLVVR